MEGQRVDGLRLVVEPNMSGHRFNYVRLLVEGAQRAAAPVAVLTTPAGDAEYRRKVTGPAAGVDVVVRDDASSLPGIAAASRRLGPERVVLPSGDWAALRLLPSAGWHGSGRLRILAIREFGQASGRSSWTHAKTAARKSAFAVARLQPGVWIGLLASSISPTRGLLPRVPDPIEFEASDAVVAELRQRHGLVEGVFWFAVVGALDERKNIPLVAGALEAAATRTRTPLGLLVVGTQARDVRDWAEQYSPPAGIRLVQADRHLSSVELDSVITLADCVVLAHGNDGPSGILGKAAAAGTRILAAGAPALRRDVVRLGPPARWCALDPEELAEQMVAVVATERPAHPFPVADAEEFVEALLWRAD